MRTPPYIHPVRHSKPCQEKSIFVYAGWYLSKKQNKICCTIYFVFFSKTKQDGSSCFVLHFFVKIKLTFFFTCPVGWGCGIYRLLLCRGIRPPPTSVLDMSLNKLMVRFHWYWRFGKYGVPLHCHRFQVHSDPEW